MAEYYLTINERPVPKQRPKVAGGHAYTPIRTRNFEQKVAMAFRRAFPNAKPLTEPIEMLIRFTFKPTESWTKSKKINALGGGIYPTERNRGDYDNLAKIITDALNGLAFDDDSQIVDAHIHKCYGLEDAIFIYLVEKQ